MLVSCSSIDEASVYNEFGSAISACSEAPFHNTPLDDRPCLTGCIGRGTANSNEVHGTTFSWCFRVILTNHLATIGQKADKAIHPLDVSLNLT